MKGGPGRKPFELKDFSGGQITKSPPKNIDPRYSIDCLNVYSEGAMLRRRDGIAVVNGTATTGAGHGVYNWVRGSDTTAQWLMTAWASSIFKTDVVAGAWDGILDPITADAASGTAFTTAGGFTYFSNYNGVLIFSNEGRQHIQRMTISENSYFNIETGGTGTAPFAKFVLNWKNHLWFMNCQGSEDTVVHSAVNSYNNFTGSTYGSNNLLTENDIGINGGFILNGRLFAVKAFSLHRFTYTGSPSPLVEIKIIKSTMGSSSPRTIKNVNTPDGEAVLFLGTNRKLYICDGQDIMDISDSIDISNGLSSVYMQAINANALNNCFAVVHEDLNWYELFLCIGTGTGDTPTVSIVYDYKTKAFWPMGSRNFLSGMVSDNGAGKRRVYVQGTSNGKLYLTHSGNSDDGAAIDYRWTSEKMGQSVILQRFDELEIETDSVSCRPTFSWRADWETTWTDKTMIANTNSNNFDPGRIDNMIQFKISGSDTSNSFKLWTIVGNERAIGGGK